MELLRNTLVLILLKIEREFSIVKQNIIIYTMPIIIRDTPLRRKTCPETEKR